MAQGFKTGGRKPGTPNKSKLEAQRILLEHGDGWDPLVWFIQVARGDYAEATMSERIAAAEKVAKRVYAELKAIEGVVNVDGKIELRWKP